MPRYNMRTLRGERVIKKKEGKRIKRWEVDYERLINDARKVLSLEEVLEEIAQTFEKDAVEQEKVSLICPLSKKRIDVPARYRTCRHLQCFDLKSFLAMKTKINFLNCPICNSKLDNELEGLCIDKYFQKMLLDASGATEIEILGNGTFREAPSHSAAIIPKVIDDEEPYAPNHSTTLTSKVKSETDSNIGDIEELSSVSSFDIGSEANAGDNEAQNLHISDTSMAKDTNQATLSTCTKFGTSIGGKRYKCSHCSFASAQLSGLKRHMRTHSGEKPYKCNHCSFASARPDDLKKHMRIHTREKPFKCSQCSYACAVSSSLKEHMRTHTGEKPYKCSQCSYASAVSNALKEHMHTHSVERHYKCNHCSFASAQPSSLKRHMRTHSGEKPYKCSHCSFASARPDVLKTHILTHTGEKPYKCSKCSFACAQSSNLKSHMRTHI